MKSDKPLSTADLARAGHETHDAPLDQIDIRGREDEQMRGRDAVQERPQEGAARVPPPVASIANSPATPARPVSASSDTDTGAPLFRDTDASALRKQWSDIQTGFVDEPRKAVERADSLVADVMKKLAEGFAAERSGLEKQWDRGDAVTTEDLRVALQRYRTFFDRLLAV